MPEIKPVRPPSKGLTNLVVEKDGHSLAYMQVPKAASSTFINYFHVRGGEVISVEAARAHNRLFAVIRNPVKRILSAYQYGWNKPGMVNPSFEGWWEHVRQDLSWDVHTQPQVEILGREVVKRPNTYLFQMEQIDQWIEGLEQKWPWAFYSQRPTRTNVSRSEPISVEPSVLDDIRAKYAEDEALWRSADIYEIAENGKKRLSMGYQQFLNPKPVKLSLENSFSELSSLFGSKSA